MNRFVLSPGVLYTDYGRFRLIRTAPVKRDDYPYKCYDTFLVTPEPNISESKEIHPPEYAITIADRYQINWVNCWIEIAIPVEDDQDYRDLVEDVITNQDPVVAMPDYIPENDPDGYSCCENESE